MIHSPKKYFAAVLPAALCLASSLVPSADAAKAAAQWKFPDVPSVNGVTLGMEEPQVRSLLGDPKKVVDDGTDEEGEMGPRKKFIYDGLVVSLCQPPKSKQPHVWQIQVNGKAWKVSPGLQTGMTREAVVKLLGKPQSSSYGEGGAGLAWNAFEFPTANFWIRFVDDEVADIFMIEEWS